MNTSHLLDAVFYITGLNITNVSAVVGTLVADVEVEDMATATMRFNNGAIGSLLTGAHVSGAHRDECCTIYGREGQIRLPDPYGFDPLRIYLKRPYKQFTPGEWHSISLEPVPVYQRAIEDYAKAIQSGDCVPVDAHAARMVLSVVLAIYQSSAERRTIFIS
jgi:predicted dehydrogenase